MASASSQIRLALLSSRGSRPCISGRYNFTPGGLLRRHGKHPNRGTLCHLSFTRQYGKDRSWSRWWKALLWRKQQHLSSTPSRRDPHSIDHIMTRELRRRGDFREPDDLSDFEFNYVYLDAMEGAPDLREHTAFPTTTKRKQQIEPRFLRPQSFDLQSSTWAPFSKGGGTLKRGHMLKIASWNLFYSSPGARARASAALAHLRTTFGQEPQNLVLMLQELRKESLDAILNDEWVRENFVLSDGKPPDRFYGDDEGLDWDEIGWRPSLYFTLMMVSRTLPIESCFRLPFVSAMGRDALVVDFPLSSSKGFKKSLRLCTTHLESLSQGKKCRPHQLAAISALLKGKNSEGRKICGGLVGGDMNSVDPSEHQNHRAPEVDLKDVWEDEPPPRPPVLKRSWKDITYGQARGHTWGYQSDGFRPRKRLDKFLYTGSVETLAVKEAEDVVGRLGRFGIGLKTKVGSDDVWVSDHFGIVVGITIL